MPFFKSENSGLKIAKKRQIASFKFYLNNTKISSHNKFCFNMFIFIPEETQGMSKKPKVENKTPFFSIRFGHKPKCHFLVPSRKINKLVK